MSDKYRWLWVALLCVWGTNYIVGWIHDPRNSAIATGLTALTVLTYLWIKRLKEKP